MKFFLYVVFYLFIFLKIIKCVDVASSELTCLINLGIKTNYDPFKSTDTQSTFCSLVFNSCISNGSIAAIYFYPNNTEVLSWSDFNCFQSLSSLTLLGSIVELDFIYNPIPSIKSLYFRSKSNIDSVYKELPSYENLMLSNLTNSYVLKASYLKNVKSFSMFGGSISFDTEGDQSNSSIENLSITINHLPILSVFSKLKSLSISSDTTPFNDSSLINIQPLSKLRSLSVTINTPNVDIFSHLTSIYNSSLDYIYIGSPTQLGPVSQKINLSGLNYLNIVQMLNNNSIFNYNGEFPFSSFPSHKISVFAMKESNFSIPDLQLFKNVSSVNFDSSIVYGTLPKYPLSNPVSFSFYNNKLTGTIDESWCNVGAAFTNNKLSGKLPDCFYCFLNSSSVSSKLSGNNFTNFFTNNVECGYSQISIYNIKFNGIRFILNGKNMGPFSNIISTPSLNYEQNLNNGSISGYIFSSIYNTTIFEFRLKAPGINFTIAVEPQTPTMSYIIQNNNTFTINGTHFSYDVSLISVKIANKNCNVFFSTFYQIQCEIGYPVVDRGSIDVVVTVSGLSSASKQFVISQTNQPCYPNGCNSNGVCDHVYGVCKCNSKWLTIGSQICLTPNQFISSTSQVDPTTGGNITLYGFFGPVHQTPQLTIGGVVSTIFSIDDNSISTSIPPGKSGITITFVQNGITWSGTIYPYIIKSLQCPNNCGGDSQGTCNTLNGQCKCLTGYIGLDCQPLPTDAKESTPLSVTHIDPSGLTTISNEQTGYQISINSVVEVDYLGNEIGNSLIELTGNWILESSENSISTFKQIVSNVSFILIVEEIVNADKQFSFAGNDFTVDKGGVKISFSISNWNYQSNLNTLRVKMISDITIDNKDVNTCNEDGESSLESSSNTETFTDNVNYLKFSFNGKILQGRFQDKMLSDGKSTFVFTKLISKINNKVTIGLDLPHCIQCLLDPDFSVLLSPDFKSSDSCASKGRKPWLIPVVVVVPVVAIAIIITVVVVVLKKNSVRIRVGLRNISMGSVKDRSRK
ncbi:hypothetical protein RB653_005359 [Dictyostelium firmibasis]|uniref:EGF-like domain-containing protein n=1 Tax=Dictyostelium firmibasis TaxID=79012 RepID=A0AAN7Z421_9MYCE